MRRPAACVLALAGLAPLLAAGDAPKGGDKGPNREAVAEKLVTQCARVREGELVQLVGSDKDVPLLEDLAVWTRKQGAFPMITLSTDRLNRRLYDDVPAKFDAQTPGFDLKLAEVIDVEFVVESIDEGTLEGVPAERVATANKALAPVFATLRKRNVRLVGLGNGLYPTPARAKQFKIDEAELANLFWGGVDVDYKAMRAAGERLKKALAEGKEIRLTHPNGTDLTARIEKRPVTVSDGVIDDEKRKQGGSACWTWLPAGEVYVAAEPETAEGRVVVDRAYFEGKEVTDLVVGVKKGRVVSLEAKAGGDRLREAFQAAAEGKDRVGVFDVGINPNVKVPATGRVLPYMAEGMVSVTVGGDTWAGGDDNSPFNLPLFLPGGTLTVDGQAVVEKGALKAGPRGAP
jgi:leucyl aminopeptidase (aminopeptidase T)